MNKHDELIAQATASLDWAHPVKARTIIRNLIAELKRKDEVIERLGDSRQFIPDDKITAPDTVG